jgi:CRP-like cAMP-binding protein
MQYLIDPRPASIDLKPLQSLCREVRFAPGDVLRRKGQHYRNLYLIIDGSIEIDWESSRGKLLVSEVGSIVGEIGFLRGRSAIATVTARTAICALAIDDPTLARLENEQPALAAHLLRRLTETAEQRLSYNLTWELVRGDYRKSQAIEVYLCRSSDMLESAKRLRYEVYCHELGRASPYADHDRKLITDHLDDSGHVFVAVEAGETIGTLRGNVPSDGPIGVYEELYGMRDSRHHPHASSICTKFIVRKSKRGGAAAMKLISAMVRYGLRRSIKECYIDCIPALLPYYRAIGFSITAPQFFHRENGPSIPMKLDLEKHGERLSEEFGMRDYLSLIMKAEGLKLIDRMRGHLTRIVRR